MVVPLCLFNLNSFRLYTEGNIPTCYCDIGELKITEFCSGNVDVDNTMALKLMLNKQGESM